MMIININEVHNNKTILNFLKSELHLSTRIITRLKQVENGICLNSEWVTVRSLLHTNDILTLVFEDKITDINCNVIPTNIKIDIIHEDDDIIIINKPYGMPTHPSHGHFEDSLANALVNYYNNIDIPFKFRAVNRLDKDTSGIVLVAKNQVSAYRLSEDLKNHKIKKTYIAVLGGKIKPKSGEIKKYIHRRAESIIFREVTECPENADFAHTIYDCIYQNDNISVVNAYPITGRTHQLRVHFAHIGYPICGDGLYGNNIDYGINRHALHAEKLEIFHPTTSERLTFTAACPQDITKLIERSY